MSDNIYQISIGQMERVFMKHNSTLGGKPSISAIPLSTAIELVRINKWDKIKHKYFVMLPKRRWTRKITT